MKLKYEIDDGVKEESAKVVFTPNVAEKFEKTDGMNAKILKHFELCGESEKDGEDKALDKASNLAIGVRLLLRWVDWHIGLVIILGNLAQV